MNSVDPFAGKNPHPAIRRLHAFGMIALDILYRVKTHGHVSLEELGFGHPQRRRYEGSGWLTITPIFHS